MSSYLMKYKGKYRLKANIDIDTKDFPRDMNGNIDSDDVYIDCSKGAQIYHYGRSTLVAYIPSKARGHNIIKAIALEILNKTKDDKIEYSEACDVCSDIIFDIIETDEEVEFKFNAKDLDRIIKFMNPRTSGANISPFSTRNLPKQKYEIPNEDFEEYKSIVASVDKSDLLSISRFTNSFLSDILAKDKLYRRIDFKQDMKKKMLRGKEYIHSLGEWDRYLTYMKKKVKELEEK